MRENTAFVISIVRKHIRNPEIVKDLTQEIFIRAFQSYDSYVEHGKIRSWLAMIANNKLKNYYKYAGYENSLSLDFMVISVPEDNPEDIFIRNEFAERVINIINSLPQIQRDVIMYRYFYNYSIEEVAKITNIPKGSVKSAGYYGLEKVKKLIGGNEIENKIKYAKGRNNMSLTNKEAYALLYEYAKGHVSDEDKAALEEYFKTDSEAANIASALKELHPKLTYARDDEMTHYNISFVLHNGDRLTYGNVSYHIENYKEMNEYLEKHDGYTDNHWFEMGSNIDSLATYDNEGNKLEMNVRYLDNTNNYHRSDVKRMKKVFYPVHWKYSVSYCEKNSPVQLSCFEKLNDAPNLYKAHTCNYFGNNTTVKSALYIAIPGEATNIRMIRGNGWHDCGTYKFAYTDRYVMGDEGNHAECTFNLQ